MRGAGNAGLRPLQPGIISRDLRPVGITEPPRDDAHCIMLPAPTRIIVELAVKIARIPSDKTRRFVAVAFPFKAVASEASGLRPSLSTAEGNDLASRHEGGFARRHIAPGKEN